MYLAPEDLLLSSKQDPKPLGTDIILAKGWQSEVIIVSECSEGYRVHCGVDLVLALLWIKENLPQRYAQILPQGKIDCVFVTHRFTKLTP